MQIKRAIIFFSAVISVVGLIIIGLSYITGFKQIARWEKEEMSAARSLSEKEKAKIERSLKDLPRKMEELKPKGIHIIIDTASNRLYLKNGDDFIRTAIVSCGSGEVLEDHSGKRKWIFDTPRGEFAVKSKIKNPYWVKPDWAFIEEGEPIPRNQEERIESGTLGDYALGFGDGYFIHGTLYTRLLGRNVTHGCVRMGDEDLEAVFKAAQIGTKIFIY